MKNIEYHEFGNPKESFAPIWHCMINPDYGLKKYYDSILNAPYDRKRFRRPGVFRNIGSVLGREKYSNRSNTPIRCLDMPIKMAGSNDYRIPFELIQFREALSEIIAWENSHNSAVKDFYAYITVDQSTLGDKKYHREPGLHVDGYQGARINPKTWCDRSYIVNDCDCPVFWNQAFESVETLDDSKKNIFYEFDRTGHYSAKIKTVPYDIYFMDSYTVHSAEPALSQKRTFLRLTFSVKQFDRLGNSHNNCFDYKWEMFERDVASSLT